MGNTYTDATWKGSRFRIEQQHIKLEDMNETILKGMMYKKLPHLGIICQYYHASASPEMGSES